MKREHVDDATLHAEYDRRKNDWREGNPDATPSEYMAACRRIADDLGL